MGNGIYARCKDVRPCYQDGMKTYYSVYTRNGYCLRAGALQASGSQHGYQ
jgi:hypothetical protein